MANKNILRIFKYEKLSITKDEIEKEIDILKDDNKSLTPNKVLRLQTKILTHYSQGQTNITKFQLRISAIALGVAVVSLIVFLFI